MIILFQVPIVDFRQLCEGTSSHLPSEEYEKNSSNILEHFGKSQPNEEANLLSDERCFFDAKGSISFPNNVAKIATNLNAEVHCNRRIFIPKWKIKNNGYGPQVLARMEVGLTISFKHKKPISTDNLTNLLKKFLTSETIVNGNSSSLANQHNSLTSLYSRSTSHEKKPSHYVVACSPALFVEIKPGEVDLTESTKTFQYFDTVDYENIGKINIQLGNIKEVPCLLLIPDYTQAKKREEFRSLFIKLYAEYEACKKVL